VQSPYLSLEPNQRWRDAVEAVQCDAINPNQPSSLRITPDTKIATAGSCFAQRISEALASHGFNYLVTEAGPPWLSAQQKVAYNYGTFSARYGNIYTSAQLLQLMERAMHQRDSDEPLWHSKLGLCDPFRPRIQPEGFDSEEELLADRKMHLAAVRKLFEELDVLVFTLGLTESWRIRHDGTVLPMCPGSGAGGEYDPSRYVFHNSTVADVVSEMTRFLDYLGDLNPRATVILTVSPVPLVATMEERHVLQSTIYSKSVLRVAAEEIVRQKNNAVYFASYETITASGNLYFEQDGRSVKQEGVAHVMRNFFATFTEQMPALKPREPRESAAIDQLSTSKCDEEALAAAIALAHLNK